MAFAWWFALAGLAWAQDLLQEPALSGAVQELPLPFLALAYLVLFLFARTYLIACPSWALARAQLKGLRAEYCTGREGQTDNKGQRDARRDIQECLGRAGELLEGQGPLGHLMAWSSLLLWNGKREMAAWALMHRAERRAVALMTDEEVRARLERGLSELEVFPEEERAFWEERLKCALGMKAQDCGPKPEPQSGGCKRDPEGKRAFLEQFLAALYDARDTSYARLLTLHNKAFWLLLVGLGLAVALWRFGPGLPNGLSLGTVLVLGFLGGLLSRLWKVVVAKGLPTDYGAYWVPLFLAPVLGALGAVGGYLIFWALVEAQVLGEGLRPLLAPPAAYGFLVLLGFSERLLEGLTKRLEEGVVGKESEREAVRTGKESDQAQGQQARR